MTDPRMDAEITYRREQVRRDWQAGRVLGKWARRIRESARRRGMRRTLETHADPPREVRHPKDGVDR